MGTDGRQKKSVKASEILHDINLGLTDEQLMTKYGLSERGLQKVRNKLSNSDGIPKLDSSGKESPLLQCPSCGMNWTQEFRECPRCGIIASKYLEMQGRAEQYGGAEPQERELEFKPRQGKTKAIMIAGLVGLLVIGLVILMKDWKQVAQKGPSNVVPKPSVGATAESDDSKSGSEGTAQYSAEVLSEMVRISVIVGLNGIGARGEAAQDSRASELFGTEMPPLNEVITSIIVNEYNCDRADARFVYVLCDYLNFKYKAEAIDYNNESDKSLILQGLALREAKFNKNLTSLSNECKKGIHSLVSLVEDTILAAKAQKAYYREDKILSATTQ